MKRNLRVTSILLIAALIAFSATMVSCSGKKEKGQTASATDEKVIKVGMMATLKPFVFTNDNDEIIGYDVDMLNAIDELLPDYRFEYQNLQFAVLFSSLQTGAVDMLTGTIGRNAEREAKYLVPSIDSGCVISSLVTRADETDINSFADLGGKSIPMDPGRYEYNVMEKYNSDHPDAAMKIIEMSDVTQADSMKMVADGRCDAALIYRDSFAEIQSELNLPVRMSDTYAVKQPYCQLINTSLTDFAKEYEGALKTLKDNGTLSKLSVKWLGYDMFSDEAE